MAASYLTQQDGTSHILLEDASGALITAADTGTADPCSILTEDSDFLTTETGLDLILEECGATPAVTHAPIGLIRRIPVASDDDIAIALALLLLDR